MDIKKNTPTALIISLTVFFLFGCVSVPLASKDADMAAKQFISDPDNASVYIYRKFSTYGLIVAYPVYVDGKYVGKLKVGSFFMLTLPPGEHDVWVDGADVKSLNKKYYFPLTVEAGEIYIIEQTAVTARTPKLAFKENREGMEAVRKCDLMEVEAIKGPGL
ncbi:MAG: DUF2846 domain-containing protein [Candidatus Thiodiazotropha lotti]|nr:DUF2846 domain-containing protein [Candidatus Thiodiazotropha lotti]